MSNTNTNTNTDINTRYVLGRERLVDACERHTMSPKCEDVEIYRKKGIAAATIATAKGTGRSPTAPP